MKKYLIISVMFAQSCLADDGFVGYGIGVFSNADHFPGQSKMIDLGLRSFLWNGLYMQSKGGFWGEGSPDKARASSPFIASGGGLEVDIRPLIIHSGLSLAIVGTTDSMLGGHFPQFNEEFYVGLRDRKGDGIGIQYQHFSSAGFSTPNQGKDFVSLQLSQEW